MSFLITSCDEVGNAQLFFVMPKDKLAYFTMVVHSHGLSSLYVSIKQNLIFLIMAY